MEVYILDSLLRRIDLIDRYVSLIWTERFAEFGDFELVVRSTLENRTRFRPGVQLAMSESYRVMTVETVENGVDEQEGNVLKISGNSIEAVTLDRIAKLSLFGQATWDITGAPAVVARKIFHDICVTGVLNPFDKIPFIVEANALMPVSDIPEPVDPISVKLPPTTVYDAVKQICDVWNLGFRMLRDLDTPQIYWDIYSGVDRTTGQTAHLPVIFSPELDNLTNTKELNSIESSKNVAYVVGLNSSLIVYPDDIPPEGGGFDRRVLYVDATDIELPVGTDLTAALKQRGKEELAQYRPFQAFDGEINQNSDYKYQVHYYLGDLVEQRSTDGVANYMRVTEQIFASDKEGDRTYPTLTKNTFVSTGSWLSEGVTEWVDYDDETTTWSDKP